MRHVYQRWYKSFPIQVDDHFYVVCRYVERNTLRAELVDQVNEPLTKRELEAIRLSVQCDRPLGDDGGVESIARRLNLESIIRPRGRQKVHPKREKPTKRPDPFLPFGNTGWT